MKRSACYAALCFGTALALSATGCGAAEEAATTTSEAVIEAPAAVASTSTSNAPKRFSPGRRYQWGLENQDGLTADLRVEFGARIPAGDGATELPVEFAAQEAACSADPQRDALLPIRLRVTNTTDGFSINPAIEVRHDGRETGTILIGTNYSDGASCSEWEIYEHLQWDGVAPGDERTVDWLLVLKDFYLPESPSGDLAVFGEHRAHLQVLEGEFADQDTFEPTCISGSVQSAWTGPWTSSLQSHFPILENAAGFGESADEPLGEC